MHRHVVLSLSIAVLASSAAHAANVVVQKNGAFPTIQAGINAAGPGGTVTVKSGVYEETPVITSNLDGLTLKASGNVIIDARLADGGANGPGILINADDVTVRGFTIRHPSAAGIGAPGAGIRVLTPGALIDKVKFINCGDSSVLVESTNTTIRNCTLIGSAFGVFASSANNTTVENCSISMCSSSGLLLNGTNPVVRKNTIKGSNSFGLHISGPNAVVEKNTVANAGSTGIYVDSADAIVRGNKVLAVSDGMGISSFGNGALIESNLVADTRSEGLYVIGNALTLRKNVVNRTGGSEEGIYASGGANITLESNVVDGAGYAGIFVSCLSLTARKNVVRRSGRYSASSAGFFLGAGGGLIEKNVAKDCHGDGFVFFVNSADILSNVATGNTIDGFDVNGPDSQVANNVALKNSGEGFDLSGTNLVFNGNTAKNNRIDVAATVAPTSFQSNQFGSGGSSTLPEID